MGLWYRPATTQRLKFAYAANFTARILEYLQFNHSQKLNVFLISVGFKEPFVK